MSDKRLVVICSNTSFDNNPLGAKPLALALAKKCDVIYVDPPLSYVTALKQPQLRASLVRKRFTQISDSLYRLTPVVLPGKDRPFINRVTSDLLRYKIRRALKKIPATHDVMLIATAPHYRVFMRETLNVYWMMDDYASQPELVGIKKSILDAGQSDLAETSNVIVTVSDALAETLVPQGHKSTTIYNGADSELFIFPAKNSLADTIVARLPETFALYVGGISDRLDISYLDAVAKTGTNLVIAGNIDWRMNRTTFDTLCARDNVTYLGAIDNDDVPALMNKASVGLVPYADGPFNRASMPLKIPEYLLCGLPVVSTDLPFVSCFSNDDVYGESTQKSFADRVDDIILNPPYPSQRAMRSSRIAQDWSWDTKAGEFLALLP